MPLCHRAGASAAWLGRGWNSTCVRAAVPALTWSAQARDFGIREAARVLRPVQTEAPERRIELLARAIPESSRRAARAAVRRQALVPYKGGL